VGSTPIGSTIKINRLLSGESSKLTFSPEKRFTVPLTVRVNIA
jgi:hypothetical protein